MDCVCCEKPDAEMVGPDGKYCNKDCVKGEYRRLVRNYGAFCEFYGVDNIKAKKDALVAILGEEPPPTATARLDVPVVERPPAYRSGL